MKKKYFNLKSLDVSCGGEDVIVDWKNCPYDSSGSHDVKFSKKRENREK